MRVVSTCLLAEIRNIEHLLRSLRRRREGSVRWSLWLPVKMRLMYSAAPARLRAVNRSLS